MASSSSGSALPAGGQVSRNRPNVRRTQANVRRPVSISLDSSLTSLAKALFGNTKRNTHVCQKTNAGRKVTADNWDLSDSFIINQIQRSTAGKGLTGAGNRKGKCLFRDDSVLLDDIDYEMLSVTSPFQAKTRYS